MINLATFDVSFLDLDNNIITWSYDSYDSLDIDNNITLSLYISESAGTTDSLSGYLLIASGISLDTTEYQDYSISGIMDPTRIWYYKMESSDGILLTADPTFFNKEILDYSTREIIRRKQIVLDKFNGRSVYLLKRRTWGTHCTVCWDEISFQAKDSECPLCYGTGWVGGYFSPVSFLATLNSAPIYTQIQMFGEWKPTDVLLYKTRDPIVLPRDIIIDDANKRWMVGQVRSTEKLGKIIEQNIQLSLISMDDKVYEYRL